MISSDHAPTFYPFSVMQVETAAHDIVKYLSGPPLYNTVWRQAVVLGDLRRIAAEKCEQFFAPKRHDLAFAGCANDVASQEERRIADVISPPRVSVFASATRGAGRPEFP
jgi:hypothetical protein